MITYALTDKIDKIDDFDKIRTFRLNLHETL